MVTDGRQTYHGEHFVMYINVESLHGTPETNRVLHVNYTSTKKKEMNTAFTFVDCMNVE